MRIAVLGLAVVSAAALAGCAGYNVDVGTGGADTAGFQNLYRIPATSIDPWAERVREPSLPPPPQQGAPSGVSTLPASGSALPPERPQAN
jgi:hypothetical protein